MKSSQEDIDLLKAYIKGRLSPEEKSALDIRLANETNLNSDYHDLKVLSEGMRVSVLENKLDLLKDLENSIPPVAPNENKNDSPSFFPSKKFWIAGIIIALITLFGWWMQKKTTSVNQQYALGDDQFYRYILHKNERNTSPELDEIKSKAYNLFTIRDFENAKPMLRNLWENQNDTLSYFYLAISELSTGNIKVAKEMFNSPVLKKYPVTDLLLLCDPQ